MSIGPYDYYGELSPEYDEVEWPGLLPDCDEEWNQWWWENTVSAENRFSHFQWNAA